MTSFLMSPRKQVFWSFCCSFFDVRMEMLHLAFYISNMRQEVQFSSVAQLRLTLCDPMSYTACQASLSITNSWSLLKLMSIASVMPFKHLILCHPLLLPPSIIPNMRVFSNESVLHIRWPKD